MTTPNFFILGAPKCGTTSLAHWLAEHPRIYFSPTKEPKYFSTDIPHQKYVNTREKYDALFAGATSDHIAIGEGSTEYLFSTEAVPNILRLAPDAKMVVCLRNPVTLAPSLHEQLIYDGDEPILDFWQAWNAQFPERKRETIPSGPYAPVFYRYGDRCKLGEQVARLLAMVPRERIFFILADELRADPRGVYMGLLEFLGVPDDGRTQFASLNTAKTLRFPRLKRWANALNYLKNRLGIRAKTGVLTRMARLNKQERGRASLPPEQVEALREYFRADVAELSALLGRDLRHWTDDTKGEKA